MASLTHVWVVVDHTMQTPLQRSTKLNISHWYFDQCHYPIKTSFPSIIFLHNFFHSHLFNETFIIYGKSHCCNDTFTDVSFTSLQAKNI